MLSERQTEMLGKTEPSQIFPEYYVIKVNQFNYKISIISFSF